MEKNIKTSKFEEILDKTYKKEAQLDPAFKANLDKIVQNTIENNIKVEAPRKEKKEKGLIESFFLSMKWQATLISSFFVFIIFSTVTIAAVPDLREKVIPTKGDLIIVTDPGSADVYITGENFTKKTEIGNTPLDLDLKEGKYKIEVMLDGYESDTKNIDIDAGERINLNIQLKKETQDQSTFSD